MKAAIFDKGCIEVKEVEVPNRNSSDVLIKVKYAGICGSDLYHSSGKNPRVKPPIILGHEYVGEILETAAGAMCKTGDRVVVFPLLSCGNCDSCQQGYYHICSNLRLLGVHKNGGFAEFSVVPIQNVFVLPANIELQHAALIEPIAVAIHAVRLSGLKPGETVVICGSGPIGLLIGLVARNAGARQVIVTELNECRLKIAQDLGFKIVDVNIEDPVLKVRNITNGRGADVVFECVGSSSISKVIASLARSRGRIVIVGLYKGLTEIDLLQVSFKELKIIGSKVYQREDFTKAINFLISRSVGEIINPKVMSLDSINEAFEILRHSPEVLKIILDI
jgi:2-desacetyl-2-hydroxyethyl bacteriochlorophyllide A dehydrogenase